MTENRSKTVVIIALCLTLIFMGVGFATLSQQLDITTTGNVSTKEAWNVKLTGFSASSAAGTIDEEGTSLIASFRLAKPGDSVTFTGNIKNFGTITAELASILNGAKEETAIGEGGYITRTITTIPTEGETLAQNATAPVSITYTFNEGITQLPDTDINVEDVITFNYVQAD